jgi:hypothetical protein
MLGREEERLLRTKYLIQEVREEFIPPRLGSPAELPHERTTAAAGAEVAPFAIVNYIVCWTSARLRRACRTEETGAMWRVNRVNGWRVGLMLLLILAAGCGRSLKSKDLDRARTAVQTGLEAWQNGESPQSLENRDPAVRFMDDDWKQGWKLVSFEITNTHGAGGDLTPRCEVQLTLQDRRGKKIDRRVVYAIENGPPITVVRDPYF